MKDEADFQTLKRLFEHLHESVHGDVAADACHDDVTSAFDGVDVKRGLCWWVLSGHFDSAKRNIFKKIEGDGAIAISKTVIRKKTGWVNAGQTNGLQRSRSVIL